MSQEKARTVRFTGEIKVGSVRRCCYRVNLIAAVNKLILATDTFTYSFAAHEIICLKVQQNKIIVVHNVKKYPSHIILVFKGSIFCSEIITRIEKAGFIPIGNKTDRQVYKLSALLIALILYLTPQAYVLGLNMSKSPRIPTMQEIIYCLVLFVISVSIQSSNTLQKLIIKPDRSFDEISFDIAVVSVTYFAFFAILTVKKLTNETLIESSIITHLTFIFGVIFSLLITLIAIAKSKQ